MAVSTALRRALVGQGDASLLVLPRRLSQVLAKTKWSANSPDGSISNNSIVLVNPLVGLPGVPLSCNRYGEATPPASNFENPSEIMPSVLGIHPASIVGAILSLSASDEACGVSRTERSSFESISNTPPRNMTDGYSRCRILP
jgi:hypothetical protein